MSDTAEFNLKIEVFRKNAEAIEQQLVILSQNKESRATLIKEWARAELQWLRGKLREAKQQCEKVIKNITTQERSRDSRSNVLLADCNMTLGKIARSIGDYEAAGKFYERARQLLKKEPPSIDLVQLEYLQGNWALFMKQFDDARKHYERSVNLSNQLNLPPFFKARAMQALGSLLYYQGNFEDAQTRFTEAMNLLNSETDKSSLELKADVHVNLGTLHHQNNKHTLAKHHFNEAIKFYRELKDLNSESVATYKLSRLLLELGNPEKALKVIEDTLTTYFPLKDTTNLVNAPPDLLIIRAESLIQAKKDEEAITYLKELTQHGKFSLENELKILDLLVRTLYFKGQHEEAEKFGTMLLQKAQQVNSSLDVAVARSHLALLKIHTTTNLESVIPLLDEIIDRFIKERAIDLAVDFCLSSAVAFLMNDAPSHAAVQVEKEIQLRKKYLDPNPFQLLALYQDLMILNHLAGRTREQEQIAKEILTLKSKILKKNPELEEELRLVTSRLTKLARLPHVLKEQLLKAEEEIQQYLT